MSQVVKDVMRSSVLSVSTDLTIGQVAKLLLQHHVHALFVEDSHGQIVGILADIDLLAGEWLFTDQESLKVLRATTARELMSSPVSSVDASEEISIVAQRMTQEHIHRLLVTEDGQPTGVISVSDIVRALASQQIKGRTVQEVMSQAIVVCRPNTPLPAIARNMSERHSRSVVVVENNGSPKGIITGRDLLKYAGKHMPIDVVAADIMREPITIAPNASLRDAADNMITHHIHRLLVTDPVEPNAIPLGLISTSDIIYEMGQPDSAWQTD
jgi:CBS domain-containing protein